MLRRSLAARHPFLVELIKPSHYDDEGYVIQWWRGFMPSNSLAVVYGLMQDVQRRRVLGDDVEVEIKAYDETCSMIPLRPIVRRFRRNHNRGVVCLVGVQSNQFPRALDIARQLRAAGIQVAIGGFHVSGCIAMLPELPVELKEALELGISLYAGEAEGHVEEFLRDAYAGRLRPVYNYMNHLPSLEGTPPPFLPRANIKLYAGWAGSFDSSRGCPFSCSFCTIINVQGRKSRYRSASDVELLIRASYAEGVRNFAITDDNFARNRNWEEILDCLIELKEGKGFKFSFWMQIDTMCHKIPNFIAKAVRAGCERVFVGLETINPDSLRKVSKGQNRVTEYRRMLQEWRKWEVIIYAGYILGFADDTAESIVQDIAIVQRELPIDVLEFFVLTPLPGCKDHRDLYVKGVRMEHDLNLFDTEHVTTAHPLMSGAEWITAYKRAWHQYYSWSHIEVLLRRAVAAGIAPAKVASTIFPYYASQAFEGVHPLQAGLFRRKRRSQRRSGYAHKNSLRFALGRCAEMARTYVPAWLFRRKLNRLCKAIARDPRAKYYTDLAITPLNDERADVLELYSHSEAARRVMVQERWRASRTSGASAGRDSSPAGGSRL